MGAAKRPGLRMNGRGLTVERRTMFMSWRGRTAVAVGLILTGCVAPSAHAQGISSAFTAPARSQLPLYRFWNGGGSMDPATFNRELDEIAANGGGGIEASTFSTQN